MEPLYVQIRRRPRWKAVPLCAWRLYRLGLLPLGMCLRLAWSASKGVGN